VKGTSPPELTAVKRVGHEVPRWEVRTLINSLQREVMTIVHVGIDLAKDVFAVHGVD